MPPTTKTSFRRLNQRKAAASHVVGNTRREIKYITDFFGFFRQKRCDAPTTCHAACVCMISDVLRSIGSCIAACTTYQVPPNWNLNQHDHPHPHTHNHYAGISHVVHTSTHREISSPGRPWRSHLLLRRRLVEFAARVPGIVLVLHSSLRASATATTATDIDVGLYGLKLPVELD